MTAKRKTRPAAPRAYTSDQELLADLMAGLQVRLAAQLEERRRRAVTDPALKGLVITDAEIDGLLAQELRGDAEAAFAFGSLWTDLEPRTRGGAALRPVLLRERFGLTVFELECVIACLAPEIERRFERIYGYLNDGVALRYPTAELLLRLFAPAAARPQLQSLLASDARLLRFAILVPGGEQGGAASYRVADGIARFLLDQGGVDASLSRNWCSGRHHPLAMDLWQQVDGAEELAALVRGQREDTVARRTPLVVLLQGRPGSGRRYQVEAACERLQRGCIEIDARLLKRHGETERTLIAAFRDSMLAGAPLLLHGVDPWLEDAERCDELRSPLERLVDELGWVLFVTAQDSSALVRWFPGARVVEFRMPELGRGDRAQGWSRLLGSSSPLAAAERSAVAESLAAKYRLSFGEMAEAMFRTLGTRSAPVDAAQWQAALIDAASAVAAPRLKALAHQVRPRQSFDDLVLAAEKKELLADIVRRLRHQRQVMDVWQFERVSNRGCGLVALFFGPTGTGKTMAAEVIAREVGLDLYRIDLAGVVSKYIGETEKNLRAVFDEADRANALLFFDEADALFGKRSEVRDAHDRYANIEINYLLQRIESLSGVAILATNMRQQLDEAFIRRIHVSVEFCMPRAEERFEIWRKSFPVAAPLSPAADLRFLAERFEIAGGTIRNIALGAAFLAAEARSAIEMPHLVAAARRELEKAGRRVLPAEFGPHAAAADAKRSRRLENNRNPIGEPHGLSIV